MQSDKAISLALTDSDLASHPLALSPRIGAYNEYAELKQIMKKRGLLEKQPTYYTWRIILLASLLTIGVVAFLMIDIFWLQLLDAAYLAFVFAQVGLLCHEAGHRQMFQCAWKHDALGLIGGNLVMGMSYGWWLEKHNTHHSHPNQMDMDPDVEIPFLEFTGLEDLEQVGNFRRFLIKRQAWIFVPALMSVALGLQTDSIKFLWCKRAKYQVLEWSLIVAHLGLYLGLVLSRCTLWQAVLFVLIHQALTGLYLGSVFAPNHKGMPVLEKESKMDFLHRQVLTARNIHGHPLTDFVYGGLNYQIEHHLFPTMPRNKLREAQEIVKTFCLAHDISYHETGILQSFKEILQHLYRIGEPLRA